MRPEKLKQLIEAGETFNVEFKGEENALLPDSELIETVVCLANRPAGESAWLLVGVEDDGRVTGLRPRKDNTRIDPQKVQALIANNTRPLLACNIEVLHFENKSLLVIEVPSARSPIGTAGGKYLRRTIGGRGEPGCVPLHFHEMQALQADRGILDYSALTVPDARWEDLDPLEFERLRRLIKESRGQGDRNIVELSDMELAKALGAVEANHEVKSVRVLGLLLFGREESIRRFMPTHEVAFQVLSGTQVEVNEFFRWPLFRTIEEVASRFGVRNKEKELMVGFIRIGIPDYPERAFREAVANALVHRDYARIGAVYIQWHEDRIEISNPGGFPEGVRLDNLLVTPPRPRNPLLADAFKRAGIVERSGRGIDTIFYEQLRNGRPEPSYERSNETNVVLVLPGGRENQDFVRLVVEESQAGRVLKVDDLLLLNHLFYERRLALPQAVQIVQKSEQDAKTILEHLVESGFIEARGERKGRTYHLSASVYKRIGKEEAYVRQRGFEPIQQEQMIIQFVKAHDRITRKQVVELCQTSSAQAKYLLNRLTKKRILYLHGKTKGAFYELKSK
jgi:ATP-dependent DNA helicase RecG